MANPRTTGRPARPRSAAFHPGRRGQLRAGGGLSLPIIGKLLGHTQAATTQRYAHLAADPLRQAADLISGEIAAAMNGNSNAEVVRLDR